MKAKGQAETNDPQTLPGENGRLTASERHLRQALRIGGIGSFEYRFAEDRVWWSPEIYRIAGLVPREDALPHSEVMAMVHPEDRDVHQAELRQILETGRVDFRHRLVRPDGAIRWIQGKAELECAPPGVPWAVLGVIQDVTEQVRAEQTVADREAELAAIYENAPFTLALFDENCCIHKINRTPSGLSFKEGFDEGGSACGVVLNCRNVGEDPSRCGYTPGCRTCVLRRAVKETIRSGNSLENLEFDFQILPGEAPREMSCLLSASRVSLGGRAFALVSLLDVTGRREVVSRLKEEEQRYRLLFEGAPEGIEVVDSQTRTILDCNPAFEKITGYSRGSLLGRPHSILHDQGENAGSTACVYSASGPVEDQALFVESRLKTRDGKERSVEVKSNPILVAGRKVIQSFYRDITEMRRVVGERDTTLDLLKLLHESTDLHRLVRGLTEFIRDWSGCSAVGVRLKDGPDFPYFEARGFPAEFVEAERFLCERDSAGRVRCDSRGAPLLECMCGNVLRGRFDPALPFFTARGSFWSNCTTSLLASTSEADRQARTRNRCNGEGYESVALIALRHEDDTLGLLQLNDRQVDRFTPELIDFLEKLADQIALALAQRQAREELRKSEERYRLLAEDMPLFVSSFLPDGILTYVNSSLAALVGSTPADLVGRNLFDLLTPENRPLLREKLESLSPERPQESHEQDYVKPDGTASCHLWVNRAIFDPQGQVTRYQAIGQDVSARRQAERDLQDSLQTSDDIVRAIPAGIFIYRYEAPDRLFLVDGNPEAEKLTGVRVEEWKEREFNEIWPTAKEAGITDKYLQALRQDRVFESEDLHYKDNRLDGAFRVRVFTLPNARLAVSFEDITDLKRAEAQRQTDLEEKTTLLQEIHHRVKNNLQIVISLLNLQAMRLEEEAVRDALAVTQNRIRAMALIHENLYRSERLSKLDFARYLEQLCRHVFQTYSTAAGRISLQTRAAAIELGIDQVIPCGLILNELVTNALKHAFPDARSGRIVVTVAAKPDGQILLEVADDGVGIQPGLVIEEVETLGLQLVCNLVRQIRGLLTVQRKQGTVVSVLFSPHSPDKPAAADQPARGGPGVDAQC